MKKSFYSLAICIAVLGLNVAAARADYTLDILHINDLHSRIEPITKYDSTCSEDDDKAGKCFGGVARLKTKIDELRATRKDGNVLVLDAGDQFQGSLFYTTYKGTDTLEFMRAIGFDAMALGNHEFDGGPSHTAEFIAAAAFPVLGGNIRVAPAEAKLAGLLKESVVLTRGGQNIGILSVLATDTVITSSPGPNVTFEDEITYLNGAVKRMEAAGVNKIILISHVGFPRDQQIAAGVSGIDVIVGGHSHTLLSNTVAGAPKYPTLIRNPSGKDVAIVQAGSFGKYLGQLHVVFDDAGVVKSATGDTILIDKAVIPDAAVAARVKLLAKPIEELKHKVVAQATAPIDGARDLCRSKECAIGDLVADAMLDRGKQQGVTIAIQNGGGLRASIDSGPITMSEVLSVLPFQNSYATLQLSGKDIKTSIEIGLSEIEEEKGRFPQVAGLRYRFDRSVAPKQGRVKSIETLSNGAWVPLQDDTLYTIATNNFMRNGGDGYALFKTNALNAYDFGPGLEEVLADYLADHSPYAGRLDGRIMDVTPK